MNSKYDGKRIPILISRKWQTALSGGLAAAIVVALPQLAPQQELLATGILIFTGLIIAAFSAEDVVTAAKPHHRETTNIHVNSSPEELITALKEKGINI